MVPLIATRIITEPLGVSPSMPTLMLPEFTGLWVREEEGGLLWGAGYGVEPRKIFVDRDPPERFDHLPLDGFIETERIGAEAAFAIPLLTRCRRPAGRPGRADLHARPARHRLWRARGRGAVGHRRRQRGGHNARPGLRPPTRRPRRRGHVVIRRSLPSSRPHASPSATPGPSPSPSGPHSRCCGRRKTRRSPSREAPDPRRGVTREEAHRATRLPVDLLASVALEEVADHREVRLGLVLEDRQVARLAKDDELAAGDAVGERAAAALGVSARRTSRTARASAPVISERGGRRCRSAPRARCP